LGDIAEVRFGIKTGANEFFYLKPTGKPARMSQHYHQARRPALQALNVPQGQT
jgi:hypothetical protein